MFAKAGHIQAQQAVFAKSAGLPDKTGIFSFCPAKTFSLSVKCPVNLSKENNILTTNMPSVLQILKFVLQKITVCLTAVLHQ